MQHAAASRGDLALISNLCFTIVNVAVPGSSLLGFGWILTSAVTIVLLFPLNEVSHPSVLTYGMGVLPAALSVAVLDFSSYSAPRGAMSLTWVTLGIFVLVTAIMRRRERVDSPAVVRESEFIPAALDSRSLMRLAFFSTALTVVGSAIFFRQVGIPLLAANSEQVRVDASQGAGIVLAVIQICSTIAAVSWVASGVTSSPGQRRLKLLAVMVVLILPALTGSRIAVVRALVGAVAAALATRNWRNRWLRITSVVVVAVFASAFIGDIRYSGGQTTFIELAVQRLAADTYSMGLILESPLHDSRVEGFGLFKSAFSTYLPGPQPLVGAMLKTQLGLDFAGGAVAVPLAAEGYLFSGLPGVLLWGYLAAWVPVKFNALQRSGTVHSLGSGYGLVIRILFGLIWAGVYGAGIATTIATFGVPSLLLALALLGISWVRPRKPRRFVVAQTHGRNQLR